MVEVYPRISFRYSFTREELEEALRKVSQKEEREWVSAINVARILLPKVKKQLKENYPEIYSKEFEETDLKSLTTALGNELSVLSGLQSYDRIEKNGRVYRIKKPG